MRIDTDLTDQDRKAVESFAEYHNLTMKGAYTQLLHRALRTRVGVDFQWGDRPDEFMVVANYGNARVAAPFGAHVPRDRAYVVSAECASHLEAGGVEYDFDGRLDDAEWGIKYHSDEAREVGEE